MTARPAFSDAPSRPAATAAPPGPREDWYWAMPELAVMFFVLAIVAFLWIVDRQEREQRRHALIGDILWLEQSIRFHLQSNEDVLAVLAREVGEGSVSEQVFRVRAAQLLKGNPELTHVGLVDPAGTVRSAVPSESGEWRTGAQLPEIAAQPALRMVAGGERPVYGSASPAGGGDAHFAVVVPVLRGKDFAGAVVGVYSTASILRQLVPWWFAQKYEVSILDTGGNVISSKSAVSAAGSDLSYQLAFDPPGRGLSLRATAYLTSASFGERMFTAVILGLTVVILWSLWMLRRHVLRRERAEAALRASHERFVAVLDGLDAAVSVRDRSSLETLYCNGRFRELYGPGNADGAYCALVPWQSDRAYADAAQHSVDAEIQDPADARWYHVRSRPVRWVDERTVQLEIATDISERKQAEELSRQQLEKLQFTSRLVTMGEMASTLAHELNQPLSAIASYNTGCLNTLQSERFDRGALVEAVEKVGAQARRAGKIIKSIHEFVRKSAPQRAPCDLNAVVEEGVGFIQAEARKKGVQVTLQLAPDLPAATADRVMIEQVVLNLAKNAVEAMQDAPGERRELTITTGRMPDGPLKVSVADTGPGMPPAIRDKLFVPFFTTKGEGMGMGLNICRSIIEYHQGRLWLEVNPEGGSVFSFTLPV